MQGFSSNFHGLAIPFIEIKDRYLNLTRIRKMYFLFRWKAFLNRVSSICKKEKKRLKVSDTGHINNFSWAVYSSSNRDLENTRYLGNRFYHYGYITITYDLRNSCIGPLHYTIDHLLFFGSIFTKLQGLVYKLRPNYRLTWTGQDLFGPLEFLLLCEPTWLK